MNSSINLISNRNYDLELKHRRLMIVRAVAVISLLFVALSSVAIFVLTAQIPIAFIRSDEASTLNDISSLHAKSAELYLASDRISNINNIIATRGKYPDIVDKIVKLIPQDMSIDAFAVENQKVTMTISGTSLLSVDQFLNTYVDFGNTGKVINGISLDSLSLNVKSGQYSLTVTAQISKAYE